MTSTEKKVYSLVKPIIEELGYRVYDVIYEKEGTNNYLRIFIDKDDGISIIDCENVNNAITDILDEKDYIKNSYMLEVSSPGLERIIRSDEHLSQNIGKEIEIHTFSTIEESNTKKITGILEKFDEQAIYLDAIIKKVTIKLKGKSDIQTENKHIMIERKDISKMNTVYNWEE